MALPFTGPCALGLGVLEGATYDCSAFAKPIATGSSILVVLAAGLTHDTPTDNAGNTYTLLGSFLNGLPNGRTSVWLASNVTGHARLQVSSGGTVDASYGLVAWPLYGTHTYNGDFTSATGTGTGPATVTTTTTPAGSIGFGVVVGNGASYLFTPSTVSRAYHSEQPDNAGGQQVYTDYVEASGPFTASWTIGAAVSWGACAFSLSGPTVPAFSAPAGLTQNLWSRTNTAHTNDDASEMEAFSAPYGFAGWLSDTQVLNAEQYGTCPWSIRSRFQNFRLDLYLKDAGGATCTRTYTWRKNGIDTLLTITVSIASSADGTYIQGTDLVHSFDLEPGDKVTLHRTGSGGSAEFDITHWSVDSVNDGNRVSAAAMVNCITNNGAERYGAPLTWKGSPVNDGFSQFRADTEGGRSLVAFNGRITRYDLQFQLQANFRTAVYPFVWAKSATESLTMVTQDGSGGTVDTRLSITDADLDEHLDVDLDFVIGESLQLVQQAPTSAFNVQCCVSVAIESTIDGEYGLSADWATFAGGHLGTTHTYSGVNKATGTTQSEKTAERIGPVTLGRMNVLHTSGSGPGVGNTLSYRLLNNGASALQVDIAGANTYGVITGTVPYVQDDLFDWVYFANTGGLGVPFILGLAMSGAVSTGEPTPEERSQQRGIYVPTRGVGGAEGGTAPFDYLTTRTIHVQPAKRTIYVPTRAVGGAEGGTAAFDYLTTRTIVVPAGPKRTLYVEPTPRDATVYDGEGYTHR